METDHLSQIPKYSANKNIHSMPHKYVGTHKKCMKIKENTLHRTAYFLFINTVKLGSSQHESLMMTLFSI